MGDFIKESAFRRYFQTNENFSILCIGYDDFATVRPERAFRMQSFYTWHFILSGRGRLDVGNESFELSAGDAFFISPDMIMRYFPDPKDPWEYVWFTLHGDAAAQYGGQLGFSASSPVLHCHHFGKIRSILKQTVDALEEERLGYFGVLSALFEIMELSSTSYRPRTEIQAVRELIDEGCTIPDFSVEKLCRDAGFSHAQLLRLFKREYGKTIRRYLIEKRLALAYELLAESNLSIRSVALSCGFSDEMHFSKSFRAHYGITASDYRKSLEQEENPRYT